MSEREIAYFKYHRETIPTSMAGSDTCRLLVLTDDQIEILSNLLAYAHRRTSWNDETIDSLRYYMPSDDDWNGIEEVVDDLEFRLMSTCDYVTLDDANERLGVRTDTPDNTMHVLSPDAVVALFESDEASAWVKLKDSSGLYNTIAVQSATLLLGGSSTDSSIIFRHGFDTGMTMDNQGQLGIGTTPAGLLHGHKAIGGFLYWETTTLNDTPQTIIPDGAGDCDRRLSCMYTITDKTSGAKYGTFQTCDNNTSAYLWNSADCTVTISVAANGAVTVQRTSGTHDAELSIFLVWA